MKINDQNPYQGNLLVEHLGPIPSPSMCAKVLTHLPEMPKNIADIPYEARLHWLLKIKDFHLPTSEEFKLLDTIDMMIRKSYSYRAPSEPKTWSLITGTVTSFREPCPPTIAAAVVGHSGVGKTQAIQRALSYYPQLVIHPKFPRIIGHHHQVVWLSVNVPASGKLEHLAANLMTAWDEAVKNAMPEHSDRFTESLLVSKLDGMRMFDEWRQVALSHSLGVLHLDEVQNFFHIPTLEKRRQKNKSHTLELSILEDKCLKAILTMTNTCPMAILFSGTPDGINALTKRFSTMQRVSSFGYHHLRRFQNAKDTAFRDIFLPQLLRYQLVQKKLSQSDELAELLIELSGGIKRLLIALWVSAHRVAFARGRDDLALVDFRVAAQTYLSPIAGAVNAINSGRPEQLAKFEDMMNAHDFLDSIWSPHL